MDREQALITAQLGQMRASLDRLRRLADMSDGDFYATEDNAALGNHHMQRAIQALLDISRHLVVRRRLGRTSSYAEIITRVYENGLIDRDLGQRLVELAHLRNRFVHVYWEVGASEVREVISTCVGDLEEFVRQILRSLERPGGERG